MTKQKKIKKTKKQLKEWGLLMNEKWMKKTTKKFRSENASRAANKRWDDYRANKENN